MTNEPLRGSNVRIILRPACFQFRHCPKTSPLLPNTWHLCFLTWDHSKGRQEVVDRISPKRITTSTFLQGLLWLRRASGLQLSREYDATSHECQCLKDTDRTIMDYLWPPETSAVARNFWKRAARCCKTSFFLHEAVSKLDRTLWTGDWTG